MAEIIKTRLAQQAAAAAAVTQDIAEIPQFDEDAVSAQRVEFIPSAAIVGTANPNNATIDVKVIRAGVALVQKLATLVLDGTVNAAADVGLVIPLVAPPIKLASNDVIQVVETQNGTGLLLPAGDLEVEYE